MRRLIALDLDGTLLPGTTVSLELARALDVSADMSAWESAYANGTLSNADVANLSASSLAGVELATVGEILCHVPMADGAVELVDAIRTCGDECVIATVTWSFAAAFIAARLGIERWCGTDMASVDGRLSGTVSRYFSEFDKMRYVLSQANSLGIPIQDCVAVGDSRSDIPLFGQVGLAIAIDATTDARAAAHIAFDGEGMHPVRRLLYPSL